MSMNIKEMRQYNRHPVDIPLECSVSEKPMQGNPYMRDLSKSGLSFISRACATPGSNLNIKIPLNGAEFEIEAVVMWCHDMEDHFEMGVKFLDENTEYSMRMVERLCHIEEYRKQVKMLEGRDLSSAEAGKEWVERFADDFQK